MHCFSRDQIVGTDVISSGVNEKPSPIYVDTVCNGLHSFIQNKHQTGFIQTNLKEFKDQRVIFSTG